MTMATKTFPGPDDVIKEQLITPHLSASKKGNGHLIKEVSSSSSSTGRHSYAQKVAGLPNV